MNEDPQATRKGRLFLCMGLDMYLSKKTYVKRWDHTPVDERFTVSVKRGGKAFKPIKPARIAYVVEEVAYWRKSNQIHAWFVENVQNGVDECQESYVEVSQLQELLDAIREILGSGQGAERDAKALELLPPQAGFFFGGTELDDYYYQDLELTEKKLAEILAEDNSEGEFYYQASW